MNYIIAQAERGEGEWSNDLFMIFMRDVKRYPAFRGNQAGAFIHKMRAVPPEERRPLWEEAVLRNTALVVKMAFSNVWRGKECGLMLLDLVQEGMFGVMTAVDRYDYETGFHFSTYATHWIRQAISRALVNAVGKQPMRIPVHVMEYVYAVQKVMTDLFNKLERPVQPHEIYAEVKKRGIKASGKPIGMKQVGRALRILSLGTDSLDEPYTNGDGDEGNTLMHMLPSNFPRPDNILEAKEQLEVYRAVIERTEAYVETLPVRTQEIVSLRLGLFGKHKLVLDEIGHRYGLTRERVRQIEAKAVPELEAVVGFTRDELDFVMKTAERLEVYILSAI